MTRCPVCSVSHPESPPCTPNGPGASKAAEQAMRDHVAREGCGLTSCAHPVCATHRPEACRACDNGMWWAECCSGRGGCSCGGQPVHMGRCHVCDGTGFVRSGADRLANARSITGPYIGSGPVR